MKLGYYTDYSIDNTFFVTKTSHITSIINDKKITRTASPDLVYFLTSAKAQTGD